MNELLKHLKRFFLLVIIFLPLMAAAQENSTATKAQKKADKKKQERIEKERKAEVQGKKAHYKIQDKATRKRMKKHRKNVDRGYPSGRPGFFKRLFAKRQAFNLNMHGYSETAFTDTGLCRNLILTWPC